MRQAEMMTRLLWLRAPVVDAPTGREQITARPRGLDEIAFFYREIQIASWTPKDVKSQLDPDNPHLLATRNWIERAEKIDWKLVKRMRDAIAERPK